VRTRQSLSHFPFNTAPLYAQGETSGMADDVIEEIQVDGTRAMIQSTVDYQVFYAFLTRLISDPFDAMTATVS
jgi:hypothetical protein